jgi:hypothetical protein
MEIFYKNTRGDNNGKKKESIRTYGKHKTRDGLTHNPSFAYIVLVVGSPHHPGA